jgi:ATPase subunit of ABC transporter with duplicated ATPase domains
MANDTVVLRFDRVSFEYEHNKALLDEASFSLRRGSKITLMGQNGAGKSSLFKLILGELKPEGGRISLENGASVAIARQVLAREKLDLSVEAYFAEAFTDTRYDLRARINDVLEAVNLVAPYEQVLREFSGGQQARLLLAFALIQNPGILLLDEPTNNLDHEGIAHLVTFLQHYSKTVIVISHDADFLNSFTEGVLYLDIFTHTIEQHTGDYFDVVAEIKARVEKAERENVRLERTIKEKKDQANVFANKGGKLRGVAKRMRDLAEDLEENKVDVRREDATLGKFQLVCPDITGPIITIKAVSRLIRGKSQLLPFEMILKRNTHLLITGPNGIGKTTFLEALAQGKSDVVDVSPEASIGYYRQDFSTLDFEKTVFEILFEAAKEKNKEVVYRLAARFLLPAALVQNKVQSLSEGQKGLLMFAKLFAEEHPILIFDEPTNHINFRHIPVIAEALDEYRGTLIFVSHVMDFVSSVRIDEVLDMESV